MDRASSIGLKIFAAVTATAVSAWLLISVVVMAGMRGAFGSSSPGQRIHYWQWLTLGAVAALQFIAVALLANVSRLRRYTARPNGAPLFTTLGTTTAQIYLLSIAVTVGITLMLAIIFALLRR